MLPRALHHLIKVISTKHSNSRGGGLHLTARSDLIVDPLDDLGGSAAAVVLLGVDGALGEELEGGVALDL